jgi:hypothetical protein
MQPDLTVREEHELGLPVRIRFRSSSGVRAKRTAEERLAPTFRQPRAERPGERVERSGRGIRREGGDGLGQDRRELAEHGEVPRRDQLRDILHRVARDVEDAVVVDPSLGVDTGDR